MHRKPTIGWQLGREMSDPTLHKMVTMQSRKKNKDTNNCNSRQERTTAKVKTKPHGTDRRERSLQVGATRRGYMNKMTLELGHADGEEHSRWKEQNEHSKEAQREDSYCGTYRKPWQPRHAIRAL